MATIYREVILLMALKTECGGGLLSFALGLGSGGGPRPSHSAITNYMLLAALYSCHGYFYKVLQDGVTFTRALVSTTVPTG